VKGRLQRDDFVVDDGVGGYLDNGMDDWGADEHQGSSDEGYGNKRTSASIVYVLSKSNYNSIQPRKQRIRAIPQNAKQKAKYPLLPLLPHP
jgi:hypothetical protein